MNRLEIDEGIRDLVRQLWKHGYRTSYSCEGQSLYSCEGHNSLAYITLEGEGNGWFEDNARKYGLRKLENDTCCKELREGQKNCGFCGAGVNGYTIYEGRLIQNPFKPEF